MMEKALMRVKARQEQAGLTLMELLVAMALGGFLVLGVVNVFLTTRESSSVESALARVQESGRFAMDILADDLRRAHYTGCNSINRTPNTLMDPFTYVGVRGYMRDDGGWSSAPDPNDPSLAKITENAIQDSIRPGTDVLNLHVSTHLGDELLAANVLANQTTFSLTGNPDCLLEEGDAIVLSSCLTTDIFWADLGGSYTCTDESSTVNVTVDGIKNDLTATFFPAGYTIEQTSVSKFESVSWYVGDTGRERNGETVYALFRQTLDQQPEEMIEGVEFMQVQYGQRGGSSASPTTRFVNADDPNLDWDEVVSVRVGLLIQNYDPVRDASDPRTYVLADPNTPIAPTDHGGGLVLRQAFRTTTALRNTTYDL